VIAVQWLARLFSGAPCPGALPWDIGEPQPALVEILSEHPPCGPVLDVGCGSGDLALHLGRSGLDVLGVDLSRSAIRYAQDKAERHADSGGHVEFKVGDATRPALLGQQFGAIVDSGFIHMLSAAAQDRFLKEVTRVLAPRGRYYVLGLLPDRKGLLPQPGVTERQLRTWFAAERGWDLIELRPAEFKLVAMNRAAVVACAAWECVGG
jgi:ubiquinone/menaquinone biosynthesis C-methylase UbiE